MEGRPKRQQQEYLAQQTLGGPYTRAEKAGITYDEELYREVRAIWGFEKSKLRVLVRGDLQHVIGETEGPVARVESIFIVISVAVYRDLEIFKIDITAAYLNTPMNEDVKHKWLMLGKDVASILMSIDAD